MGLLPVTKKKESGRKNKVGNPFPYYKLWALQNLSRYYPFPIEKKFGPFQIESICRRQNQSKSKVEICYVKSKKHCGKRKKNVCYQHFILFPQCFQKVSPTRSLNVRIVW